MLGNDLRTAKPATLAPARFAMKCVSISKSSAGEKTLYFKLGVLRAIPGTVRLKPYQGRCGGSMVGVSGGNARQPTPQEVDKAIGCPQNVEKVAKVHKRKRTSFVRLGLNCLQIERGNPARRSMAERHLCITRSNYNICPWLILLRNVRKRQIFISPITTMIPATVSSYFDEQS